MKQILVLAFASLMVISLAACGCNSAQPGQQSATPGESAQPGTNTNRTEKINSPNTEAEKKEQTQMDSATKNSLVAYFSRTGNTSEIANQIHDKVCGDIFKIETVNAYPADYNECVEQAKQELEKDYRPKLKTEVKNMESYKVVFIGYPNWWGTMPMAVFTFLESYDFSGKTIIPFCTHEGSRFGRSVTDITKLCPKSTILDGLAIRGGDAKYAWNEVSEWLRKLGMIK
jgi:flavodoxin